MSLVRQPDVRRQSSGLPEHVDRNSAAWGPVAADAEVGWLESRRYAFADDECAFLVEVAVVPEGCEIKLQRLGFNELRGEGSRATASNSWPPSLESSYPARLAAL